MLFHFFFCSLMILFLFFFVLSCLEYGIDLVNKHCITESLERSVEEEVEMVTATSGLLQSGPINQCNSTPLTPSFRRSK